MKTERRHELETNQLADSLGRWVEAARPYTNAIVAGVLILLVTIAVYAIAQRRSAAGNAQAWDQFMLALNRMEREKLEDIAENNPHTAVGHWSLFMAANLFLDEGSHQLFRDRGLAREYLRKAADDYQTVLSETRDPDLIKQASYGRARAHECLGDVKAAQQEYETFARQWPDSPFAAAAESRVKDLRRQETREFYDWFATQNVRGPSSGGPGLPGFRPRFEMDTLPDSSGLGGAPIGSPGADSPSAEGGTAPDDSTPGATDADSPTGADTGTGQGTGGDKSPPSAEDKSAPPGGGATGGKDSGQK